MPLSGVLHLRVENPSTPLPRATSIGARRSSARAPGVRQRRHRIWLAYRQFRVTRRARPQAAALAPLSSAPHPEGLPDGSTHLAPAVPGGSGIERSRGARRRRRRPSCSAVDYGSPDRAQPRGSVEPRPDSPAYQPQPYQAPTRTYDRSDGGQSPSRSVQPRGGFEARPAPAPAAPAAAPGSSVGGGRAGPGTARDAIPGTFRALGRRHRGATRRRRQRRRPEWRRQRDGRGTRRSVIADWRLQIGDLRIVD